MQCCPSKVLVLNNAWRRGLVDSAGEKQVVSLRFVEPQHRRHAGIDAVEHRDPMRQWLLREDGRELIAQCHCIRATGFEAACVG